MLDFLRGQWARYLRPLPVPPQLPRQPPDDAITRFRQRWAHLANYHEMQNYVAHHQQYFTSPDTPFWQTLIADSFPSGRNEIIRILLAVIHGCQDHLPTVLQCFLRGVYTAVTQQLISMSYFAAIVSRAILQLRFHVKICATMFGGFLNDIKPSDRPQLIAVWFYTMPLVLPALLADENLWLPTGGLVVAMLYPLGNFPPDWGTRTECRRVYKAILRTLLLIAHDAPRFIAEYWFDFVSAVPLCFRRIRNVVLACAVPDPILCKSAGITEAIIALKAHAPIAPQVTTAAVIACLGDVRGKPLVRDFGRVFVVYAGAAEDKERDDVLWRVVRVLLSLCTAVEMGVTFCEAIVDMLRHPCAQTASFLTVAELASTLDMAWDGITLQQVLLAVVAARIEVAPVPAGVKRFEERIKAKKKVVN
jgi:hypothetical protein